MGLMMNTNVAALATQRTLSNATNRLSTTFERLSSGKRINRAADDAAGLSISTRMNAQVRGFNQSLRNVNDGVSLSQVAQGALKDVQDTLQRMRELAVQASNDTNSTSDRQALHAEFDQLRSHISQVASQTEFNGMKLLDGSFSDKKFHVSSNSGQTLAVDSVMGVSPSVLGTGGRSDQDTTGWTQSGNSLYKFTTQDTWDGAEAQAKAAGGHLVAIGDQTENDFINGLFSSIAIPTGMQRWIGLNDIAHQGSWKWTNGDDLTFSNWASGQPDSSGQQHVGSMVDWGGVNDGKWDDYWRYGNEIPLFFVQVGLSSQGVGVIEKPVPPESLAEAIITSNSAAEIAITIIDNSINDVAGMASTFGAFQNRMDSIAQDLMVMSQNTAGAKSRIEDADYAAETANMAKNSIVQQAGTAILAQANQQPNIVMQLLK
ncbi:MAG: hypothetical protein HQM04_19320 [Magnetococcales bacterium]|nr:hypothetical protein [Magnetococcales bacterium]MBF0117176.1 hypothetical protein [Magnetococcales bacterium]